MMMMMLLRLSERSLSLSWCVRRNDEEIAPRSFSPFSSSLALVERARSFVRRPQRRIILYSRVWSDLIKL